MSIGLQDHLGQSQPLDLCIELWILIDQVLYSSKQQTFYYMYSEFLDLGIAPVLFLLSELDKFEFDLNMLRCFLIKFKMLSAIRFYYEQFGVLTVLMVL